MFNIFRIDKSQNQNYILWQTLRFLSLKVQVRLRKLLFEKKKNETIKEIKWNKILWSVFENGQSEH